MRSINTPFRTALQADNPNLCELITHGTAVGTFSWTSNNVPVVNSGVTYDPFPGGAARGAEETTDLTIGTVGFSIANSGDYYNMLRSGLLDKTEVMIRRVFVDSPNMGDLYVFRGYLGDLIADRNMLSGQVRNIFQSATINWPYYVYGDTCTWKFGGVGCGLNTTSFTLNLSLDTSSSSPIIVKCLSGSLVQSFAPGQLERGRLTMTSGPNSGQTRVIRSHSGDVLGLSHTFAYANSGAASLQIVRGCRKRLITDCVSQFNNGNRHFGEPWMPKQEQAF